MAKMGIQDTLEGLIDCIATSLEKDGNPVCTAGTTIGRAQIANCCECSPGKTGELWGAIIRLYRLGGAGGYNDAVPQKPCLPTEWAAEFQITLARCFPTIDKRGELPSPKERGLAAGAFHKDMATMERAIRCCDTGEPAYLLSLTVDTDPEGGCSYLTAVVRVPVSTASRDN